MNNTASKTKTMKVTKDHAKKKKSLALWGVLIATVDNIKMRKTHHLNIPKDKLDEVVRALYTLILKQEPGAMFSAFKSSDRAMTRATNSILFALGSNKHLNRWFTLGQKSKTNRKQLYKRTKYV